MVVSIVFAMIHLFIRRANFIDENWIEEKKEEEEEGILLFPPLPSSLLYKHIDSTCRCRTISTMRLRDKMDDEAMQVNGALGLIRSHRRWSEDIRANAN